MEDEKPQDEGGFGGAIFDRPTVRKAELNLIRRAVKGGWNVRDELKKKILDRVELIVDAEQDEDIFLKAARIAVEADKADMAFEKGEKEKANQSASSGVQVNINLVEQVVSKQKIEEIQEQPPLAIEVIESKNGRNGHHENGKGPSGTA